MKEKRGFANLWATLQALRRRRERRHQQVLVLALESERIGLGCWQDGISLWQKECPLPTAEAGSEDWWENIVRVVREATLFARLPEQAQTLLLVGDDLLRREEVGMPRMGRSELLRALRWEAEQFAEEENARFGIAYRLLKLSKEEQQLELFVWPEQQLELASESLTGLHLRLADVLVGFSAEELPRLWFGGVDFVAGSLAAGSNMRRSFWRSWDLAQCARKICLSSFLLGILALFCAQGGVYFLQRNLADTQNKLAEYALWEERLSDQCAWARELERNKQRERAWQKLATHNAQMLRSIGRQVNAGLWLETLRCEEGGRVWRVEGGSTGAAELKNFVENLGKLSELGQVRLQQSSEVKNGMTFAIVLRKESSK